MGKYPTRDAKEHLRYTYGQDRHNQWSRSESTSRHTVGSGDRNQRCGRVAAHGYNIYQFDGSLLEYN